MKDYTPEDFTPASEDKGYLLLCHEVSTAWMSAGFREATTEEASLSS